jgi:hypothetical protein
MRKYLLFLIALASVAFGVCSPAEAQFVTLGAQGCGGASCAGGGGSTLSIDGSNGANTGGSATLGVALTTTKTNDVVVVVVLPNGGPVVSVSDGTNSFTKRSFTCPGQNIEEWYHVYSGTFSGTITVTQTSSMFMSVSAFGINGAHTAAPFDTNASVPNCDTTIAAAAISTSNANDIIYGGNSCDSTGTATSPWTLLYGSNFALTEYQIVSTTQSGITLANSCSSGSVNRAFMDAIIQGP